VNLNASHGEQSDDAVQTEEMNEEKTTEAKATKKVHFHAVLYSMWAACLLL